MKKKHFLPLQALSSYSLLAVFLLFSTAILDANQHLETNDVLSSIVAIENAQIKQKSPYSNNGNFFPQFESISLSSTDSIESSQMIGAGVIIRKIKSTYYVLTNFHVVEGASALWLTLYNGEFFKGQYHSGNKLRDLAIVTFESSKSIPLAKLAIDAELHIGDAVYAVGNPYGFTFTMTMGIISAFDRSIEKITGLFIQTDAPLNPGNSGGVIVNTEGQVIGISTWIYAPNRLLSGRADMNFAIAIQDAYTQIEQLLEGKAILDSWLGIALMPSDSLLLRSLGVNNRHAVVIGNIFSSLPSASKLHIGDAIVAVNGKKLQTRLLDNYSSVFSLIANSEPETPVQLHIIRQRREVTIQLTSALRPEDSILSELTYALWPGFLAYPLPDYKKQLYGMDEDEFVLRIHEVYDASPADSAGLRKDDLLLEINNARFSNYNEFTEVLNNLRIEKKEVPLKKLSNGSIVEHTVLMPPLVPNYKGDTVPSPLAMEGQ